MTSLAANSIGPEARPAEGPSATNGNEKQTARLAGVFYLLVAVFGGFAEGFAEPAIYALPTAQALVGSATLARFGVVADLLDQVFFLAAALTLYALLRHVHRGAARAMVALVAVAAAIAGLSATYLFEAVQIASNPVMATALGAGPVDAVVHMLLDMQHYGLLAAQLFFGLWLAPLGYLVLVTGRFPKALGVALLVAAGCYVIDLLAAFLLPDVASAIHPIVVIPCAIAEIWMVLYLLTIGIRPQRRVERS